MPVVWDDSDLSRFFGGALTSPVHHEFTGRTCSFSYKGAKLKYELLINVESEMALISGDYEKPFGFDSHFEVPVPCDSITSCVDGYYPEQTTLLFWYGNTYRPHNQTMQLLKRPDGDLKVWPGTVLPPRHPNFKMIWGDNSPPVA